MAGYSRPAPTLRDHWHVIVRRRVAFGAVVAIALVVSLGLSLLQNKVYRASAQVIVRSTSSGAVFGTGNQTNADARRRLANEVSVLSGVTVRERVKSDLALVELPPPVATVSEPTTDVVVVSVDDADPVFAALVVNAYVAAYNEVKREQAFSDLDKATTELEQQIGALQASIDAIDDRLDTVADDTTISGLESERRELVSQQSTFQRTLDQRLIDSRLITSPAELVQPAEAPTEPVEPTPVKAGLMGLLVGLFLGVALAFGLDHLDQSIRSTDDLVKVGSTLPTLAVVPLAESAKGADARPVVLDDPTNVAAESFRSLRTAVQFVAIDRDAKVIQVTSAAPGEGKTTTAANLAIVLAQVGMKVVLVDGDLRKPRLDKMFGLPNQIGLVDNLVGTALDRTTVQVEDGLDVIPSGRIPANPSEMLSSNRMSLLLAELRGRYDYVVVDSAPVLPASDATALSRHVDAVLFVVHAGRSTAPQVRQAMDTLERVEAPQIGIVLNQVRSKALSGYGYGYGYGASVGR